MIWMPAPADLIQNKMTAEQTAEVLQRAAEALKALPEFIYTAMEEALRPMAESMGLKLGQFRRYP